VRFFNTAGVCFPDRHYMLPPEPRLPDARRLIDQWQYFIVHAPRQSGKTTTLETLAGNLNAEGRHAALRVSCERAGEVGDDLAAASAAILEAIRSAADQQLPERLRPPGSRADVSPGSLSFSALQDWAVACPLPLVLLFDEIDSLHGFVVRSVLHQIRDGHSYRAHGFPASVVLCGMRDVRDYKAAAGGDPSRLGSASPFNVAVKSIRIGDFTLGEVAALYEQHTAETGQEFQPGAVERAFDYSQGQPWLVNALANEIAAEMGIVPPVPITMEHVDTAKERLILARAPHFESLAARLNEPRVRRVIEPLIAGELPVVDEVYHDDVAYVRDLGLIAVDKPARVANPIYREVIVRLLGAGLDEAIDVRPHHFVLPDGRLDFPAILNAFAGFWAEHEEILDGIPYREVAMQLAFMAFLSRAVNVDLLVRKPYGDHQLQREAIELKAWHSGRPDPLPVGLDQLDRYLTRLKLDAGTLVIFDRRPGIPPAARRTSITRTETPEGRAVTLMRA
jgi:AAA domain-containing protein